MPVVDETELADSLEAFLQHLLHSQTEADLHAMVELDLPISQFRCLIGLACEAEARPIHELADTLHMSVATAGRNIDRLVAQGLVSRREDPSDRRVRRVSLSDRGSQAVTGIDAARRTSLLNFARSLAPADRTRLHAALTPIVNPAAGPDATTAPHTTTTSHLGEKRT